MAIGDEEIRRHLRLGEDNDRAFRRIAFEGTRPTCPGRDDLADELTAFANAGGGTLLCGVTDDGEVQGMSRDQAKAVVGLLTEICTDAIRPPLHVDVRHRELDGKAFVLAQVPRGDAVHQHDGRAFIRVGARKLCLDDDQRLRLAQIRGQNRYLRFDRQIVPGTGFGTLDERLWEPLLSVAGAAEPRRGLTNLRILGQDESGAVRATNAGLLLCARSPQDWLPHAAIMATSYRGKDRASGQLDAREITGPLSVQIADAVQFVVRNMRVAARKIPERVDMPQYSLAAVFEAVVNAVAHRDYAMAARRIRLSMFKDRLEIESPGGLPNGMTMEAMAASQATRNEAIASVFGRVPVGDIPGADDRRFLMERRGDGVSIVLDRTWEVAGALPQYSVVDGPSVVVRMPAAKLELSPSSSTVTVHAGGEPLPGVQVLALFPNKTWLRATTDEAGEATLDLYTTDLPMTVYAAAPGYAAGVEEEWLPGEGGLPMELRPLAGGGAVVFQQGTGHLPGLRGRLNPIRDTHDRTYLYADNIAIEDGRQQPVPFRVGKPMKLTDAHGGALSATVVSIIGRAALVEYRPFEA